MHRKQHRWRQGRWALAWGLVGGWLLACAASVRLGESMATLTAGLADNPGMAKETGGHSLASRLDEMAADAAALRQGIEARGDVEKVSAARDTLLQSVRRFRRFGGRVMGKEGVAPLKAIEEDLNLLATYW